MFLAGTRVFYLSSGYPAGKANKAFMNFFCEPAGITDFVSKQKIITMGNVGRIDRIE